MNKKSKIIMLIGAVSLTLLLQSKASDLVYTPISPSFGGFSSNGAVLLNQAQAQNDYKDPDAYDPFADKSSLDRFGETLERQILSQLARRIVEDAFGTGSGVGTGGIYTTDNFSIEIDTTDPAVINLNVTDLSTGDISTIQIPYF